MVGCFQDRGRNQEKLGIEHSDALEGSRYFKRFSVNPVLSSTQVALSEVLGIGNFGAVLRADGQYSCWLLHAF